MMISDHPAKRLLFSEPIFFLFSLCLASLLVAEWLAPQSNLLPSKGEFGVYSHLLDVSLGIWIRVDFQAIWACFLLTFGCHHSALSASYYLNPL